MKKINILCFLFWLAGCTQVQVRELNSNIGLHHVCIEENPKVIVSDFVPVVRRGFERHGITTELISGSMPEYCQFHLTYTALKTWDMAMYMHHAELQLYEGAKPIAYAEYHLAGGGGLALNKWASVEAKMNPVIDKLLSNYTPEYVDVYRKEIEPKENVEKRDKEYQLKKLKEWYEGGFISKDEYESEKGKVLKQ